VAKIRKPFPLRAAAWLCWSGGGLILLTLVAFVSAAIYEWIVPPTDMHLPGLLTAVMMFCVAPVGAILLALGGLMRLGLFLAYRRTSTENTSK
jgi:hypothetical protein